MSGARAAKKYRSPASAAIHETVSDMCEDGGISRKTMRGFDADCLTPIVAMTPETIQALRKRELASQAEQSMRRRLFHAEKVL